MMRQHLEQYIETENNVRYASLLLTVFIIAVYGVELFSPGFAQQFALYPPTFWHNPWTILTAIFIHSPQDYMHLLNNMYFLAIFGFILENVVGTKRFLTIFFATGLFANLAAFTFYPNSALLGASGAISGIIAVLAVIKPRSVGLLYGLPVPMWVALVGWFLINLVQAPQILTMIGATVTGASGGGTAFMAHLYGIGFGLTYGLFIRKRHPHLAEELRRKDEEKGTWHWDDEDVDLDEWEKKHMK